MVNLRSLIAAVEAGVAMAAPTYAAGDVSITVENGIVVASATAGGTSYSISTTQRSVYYNNKTCAKQAHGRPRPILNPYHVIQLQLVMTCYA